MCVCVVLTVNFLNAKVLYQNCFRLRNNYDRNKVKLATIIEGD